MGMAIKKSIISFGLIAVLAGCIDSGGDDEADEESGGASGAERISFTGLVADGYLDGATVCLDINENKECDANDPTATSGEGGAFSITDATQAQRDQFPLLVEVVVGTTIDEDNAGVALTKPLTLTAPAGYGFISPLSTMVQNEVEGGSTASAAEEAVQAKLGTTLDLDSDYIEGKASGSNAEEYEQLHQVAQVTARVISDNMETLADAAAENNISLDDLISAIVDEVFDALDEIATEVEEIAADDNQTFDPDAVATEVNDELVDLAPETIEEQVEQNQAEEAATSVDMSQLLLAPGLTGFWAEIDMGNLNADYWTIYNNAQGDFQEDIKIWDSGSGAFVVDSGTPEPGYILKAAGWEAVANLDTPDSIVGGVDGTITITKAGGAFIERLISTEVDLTGLNTRLTMNDVEDGDGIWGEYLAVDTVFPAGSKGYTLADNGSDTAYIFEDWDDCGGSLVGGLCSFSYVQNGPVDGQAQSFSDIMSTTAYVFTDVDADDLVGIKAVEVGYSDTHKLWAEIVTGGVVNFYKVGQDHGSPDVSFLGASTWGTVTLNPAAAIELVMIPETFEFDYIAEDGNVILGLIAGYIRQADIEGAGGNDPQLRLLNATATAAVTGSNFSLNIQSAEFSSSTAPGTYTLGCSANGFVDDCTITLDANGTGTSHWPIEGTTPAFDTVLTWEVIGQGQLKIIHDGDQVEYQRYTITNGTTESGFSDLDDCLLSDDSCTLAVNMSWIKQ